MVLEVVGGVIVSSGMKLFVAAGPFVFERRDVEVVGDDNVPRGTPTIFNKLVEKSFFVVVVVGRDKSYAL